MCVFLAVYSDEDFSRTTKSSFGRLLVVFSILYRLDQVWGRLVHDPKRFMLGCTTPLHPKARWREPLFFLIKISLTENTSKKVSRGGYSRKWYKEEQDRILELVAYRFNEGGVGKNVGERGKGHVRSTGLDVEALNPYGQCIWHRRQCTWHAWTRYMASYTRTAATGHRTDLCSLLDTMESWSEA
jgi:hypothetical protein